MKKCRIWGCTFFASNKKTVILQTNDKRNEITWIMLTGWFKSHPDGTQRKADVYMKRT